jgi:alpha/beta superfamily hydrolase
LERAASKIRTQKGELVEWEEIEGADHFYRNELDLLRDRAAIYLDRRLAEPRKVIPPPRR